MDEAIQATVVAHRVSAGLTITGGDGRPTAFVDVVILLAKIAGHLDE